MGLRDDFRAHGAGVACLRRFETVWRSATAFARRGKNGSAGRWSGSPGGAGMERSGIGLNWPSQAPFSADVPVEVSSGGLRLFKLSLALYQDIRYGINHG
jgi:hypothetical protein